MLGVYLNFSPWVGRPQCCLSRNVIKTEILDSLNMFYLVMIPRARWLSRQWMLHSINMFCLLPKPKFFIVEEEEKKNCFKITQNLLYCSLRYIYKHIGTPKFLVKVLWVYSHLKSDFFSKKKLLNVI